MAIEMAAGILIWQSSDICNNNNNNNDIHTDSHVYSQIKYTPYTVGRVHYMHCITICIDGYDITMTMTMTTGVSTAQ